jgi:hypothetical protein
MDTTAALVRQATLAGISLAVKDGQVHLQRNNADLPAELVDNLRNARAELLAYLTDSGRILPPTSPPGHLVDLEGNTWKLQCRCGLHPLKGHEAKPVTHPHEPEAT